MFGAQSFEGQTLKQFRNVQKNKPHVFPDAIGQVENAEIEDEEQLFANELVVIEKENDGDTEFANE